MKHEIFINVSSQTSLVHLSGFDYELALADYYDIVVRKGQFCCPVIALINEAEAWYRTLDMRSRYDQYL